MENTSFCIVRINPTATVTSVNALPIKCILKKFLTEEEPLGFIKPSLKLFAEIKHLGIFFVSILFICRLLNAEAR